MNENLNGDLSNKTILILGYGSIGKCFVEILLDKFPFIKLKVLDMIELPYSDKKYRFEYIRQKIDKENIESIMEHLNRGDVLIDLSTNIDCLAIWPLCIKNGVNYLNTAMEEWEDSENPCSFPKTLEELYKTSLGYRHDEAHNFNFWNSNLGTTSLFEHGMNPGIISHFVKKGILDAAEFFLKSSDFNDLNKDKIRIYLEEKNFPKLAYEMGLETIHCSEHDDQWIENPPTDLKEKFYNTWSCRGFLTEGMVPCQIARGSHENEIGSHEFPVIKDNSLIMSWTPSKNYWCKSWVPTQNIVGCIIPHGEAYSIRKFLFDKETGYAPSQYYVYDYNPYAKIFINSLNDEDSLQKINPEMEVIQPINHILHGVDKVGAMLIFKNNRGWWTGSIMDNSDSKKFYNGMFGPTSLQVGAGVYAAFLWILQNPNSGNKWPEEIETDFILQHASEFIGQIYSNFVDLNETLIKDCHKFEEFLVRKNH